MPDRNLTHPLRTTRRLQGLGSCVILLLAPQVTEAQVLQGRVVAAETAEPIARATVHLLLGERGDRSVASSLTGDDGRFLLRVEQTGTYRLRGERIGYTTAVSAPFDLLRSDEPLEVELRLAVDAIALAPLTILSDRPPRLNLRLRARGYYDRKRSWVGTAHFIDGEDIDRNSPFWVSDVAKGLPGVYVVPRMGPGNMILVRGRCVPTVFVDGVPAATGADIDDVVPIGDLLAVEIYPGLARPAEFIRSIGGGERCGVVAVWTGSPHFAPDPDAAEGQGMLAVELRTGLAIGDYAPTRTGFHGAPRGGVGGSVSWRILSRTSVHAGASLVAFRCDRGSCEGHGVTFRSAGLALGTRFHTELPGRPWVQVGAIRHRLRTKWETAGEPARALSDVNLGYEAAAGVAVPLTSRVSLTPGLRFVRYVARGAVVGGDADRPIRARVTVVELGTGIRFEL